VNDRPFAAEAMANRMTVFVMTDVVRARHAAMENGLKRYLQRLLAQTTFIPSRLTQLQSPHLCSEDVFEEMKTDASRKPVQNLQSGLMHKHPEYLE
jgi:hypothetical protein